MVSQVKPLLSGPGGSAFFSVAVNSRPTCLTVQIGGKTFSTLVSIFFWIYSLKANGVYCWTPLSLVINIFWVIRISPKCHLWFSFLDCIYFGLVFPTVIFKLHGNSVLFHSYLSYFSAFCPYIWKSTTCHFKNGTLYRQMAPPCPPLLPPAPPSSHFLPLWIVWMFRCIWQSLISFRVV